MQQASTEKLMRDLRVVVNDAEELIKATAGQGGERVQQLRAKTEQSLREVRGRIEAAGHDMDRAAREAVRNVDSEVRDHPWTAVGVAAGIGVLLGVLLGRK